MIDLQCFESRMAGMQGRYPEMPARAVTMVRFVFFLQRRLEERLASVLEARGLSHSAWSLMIMIHSDPAQSISPSAASDALRQSRPHMTRIADDLVARGWIERVQDPIDRRAVVLRLTAAGSAALKDMLPIMWAEYESLVSGFPDEDAQHLCGLLRDWLADLERPDGTADLIGEDPGRG
ncbi:MarR family transcriptional regulator [Azoarcus sp. L1K30]|uniref:MarR family winged helix-turn-helix transcriptional regulator n=1 Tax=Azoarcus sp. L1K30 TaxID=2820277 RepID=UPI001B817ABB|nr:MarR family transcriptional regulator [Azoarcus sp. L1K30]MBR0565961.1 MarR family transcriptional regulator [Azoarcus sp. L1K30]